MIPAHYNTFTKDTKHFNNGQDYIIQQLCTPWEVQKAIAIQILTSAMCELKVLLLQTTTTTLKVVYRRVYANFTTLYHYLAHKNTSTLILSFYEKGKACGNPEDTLAQ